MTLKEFLTAEMPYDWRGNSNIVDDKDILDANIQRLYETIMESHPEYEVAI